MYRKDVAALCVIFLALAFSASAQPVFLDQNWSHETDFAFWFEYQGSLIMPTTWFMRLEVAPTPADDPSTPRARFALNLDRYGFIPDSGFAAHPNPSPDPKNPLPIGFTSDSTAKGAPWVGLTCAACHTAKINYQGKSWLIEGGPGMLDFDKFLADMAAAIDTIAADPTTAQRFWNGTASPADKALFQQIQTSLDRRKMVNTPPASAGPAGFGRVDAFDHIFNQVLSAIPTEGARNPDAPASYPFLWDIAQHDLVQWNGSAPNLGVGKNAAGSLLRNIGEVLGVFGEVTVTKKLNEFALPVFDSSAAGENLRTIEEWISTLRSPSWPPEFPPINQTDRAAGEQIYSDNCKKCHALVPRDQPVPDLITAWMEPVDNLLTDRQEIDNFRLRTADAGQLGLRFDVLRFPGDPFFFSSKSPVRDLTGYLALGVYMKQEPPDLITLVMNTVLSNIDKPKTLVAYKGRPLDGIWATAPYLHNGSVPNLVQLLTAPESRITTFCVGDGEFDSVNVGYATYSPGASCPNRTSLVDTRTTGSSNLGHSYGTQLNRVQKRQLIEYLKSL